jgi:SAM-dependent methyltransferase
MFDAYRNIFNQRGAAYHAAMTRFPGARDEEFAHIIAMADLLDGQRVLDIPSGGGYLRRHIPQSIALTCVETSREFAAHCAEIPGVRSLLRELHDTQLPSAAFDRIICLAGLHHVREKERFFAECARVLKPDGLFCIADAAVDSRTARFLDEFVHAHHSMGHQGDYISGATRSQLHAVGFAEIAGDARSYHWRFASTEAMTTFCTLLFGMDRATPVEALEGISQYLGYEQTSGGVVMNWELQFLACSKINVAAAMASA